MVSIKDHQVRGLQSGFDFYRGEAELPGFRGDRVEAARTSPKHRLEVF
jgi:hypothetical protein